MAISLLLGMAQIITQPASPSKDLMWEKVGSLCDEFNGFFNKNKWFNYHSQWEGRLPSKFKRPDKNGNNSNVFTTSGKLALRSTLHKDPKKVKNR